MIAAQTLNQPEVSQPAYLVYPPSLLMIEDSLSPGNLKRKLEQNNYQVTWTNLCDDGLSLTRWVDFDLILFNLSQSETTRFIELCNRLLNNPQLAKIPVVIMAPRPEIAAALMTPQRSAPVYYLPNNSLAETKLLRIVDQIHYISYRYI
jgi:CheY-like chemotaxis protein